MRRFLLGLTVAVACLLLAMEYSVTPDDPLDDPDLLEMLSGDEDLSSLMRPEDELALAPKAEPKPAQRLKVVDEDVRQDIRQDDEIVETDTDNDMEAMEDEAEQTPPDQDDQPEPMTTEDLPQFPGGATEFMKWLTRNLKYPAAVSQQKVQGKVVAEFIVNTDGSVTDVKIIKPLHPQCDNEVLRVLRMMPRWTAGTVDNKPCRTKVCIPVMFKI